MERIKQEIKKYLYSRNFWILSAIIIVGMFLRAYHIHDWVRFGPDQARDAAIIKEVLENKKGLPFLGPQAGNTSFYLGPVYYYFEYAAGLLFGSHVVSFILPVIFFSILSIPLFYFLLRKIFDSNISLTLTALYSLSFFVLTSSRYASNTNFIPFFLLLFFFSILKIVDRETRNSFLWYGLWGISLGVGIQLHTLLFISLPIICLLALFFIWKNGAFKWKGIAFLAVCFLLVNYGQVKYDLNTGGANIRAFFKNALSASGSGESSNGESKLGRNIKLVASCQLQANVQILFPIENRENCEILDISTLIKNDKPTGDNAILYIFELIALIVFSAGGYILLFYYAMKKDTHRNLRIFLCLSLVYNVATFLIFVPVATEIGVRYFIVLAFMPFVLLGLWIKGVNDFIKNIQWKNYFTVFAVVILALSNVYVISQMVQKFATGEASDDRLSVLGEIKPIADYITSHSGGQKTVYLGGGRVYVSRYAKALNYLTEEQSVTLAKWRSDSNTVYPEKIMLFDIESDNFKYSSTHGQIDGNQIVDHQQFGNISIFLLNYQNDGEAR